MAGYIGSVPVPQATETRDVYTATANQTTFTTGGYTPNFVSVYLNGVHLARADYTATNGSDVVLAVGAAADDTVEIVSFATFEVSAQTFTGDVTASGGTFLPTGDTEANDVAAVGYAAADGLVLTGQGSTSDVTIKNDADATVMSIPTGTTGATFAGSITSGGAAVKVAGKETIWVPASAMQPTTSNGCSALTTVETTSGRPDLVVLDFDKDSDEFAQFSVAFPKSWNEGTVTFQFFWSGIAATTGVTLGLQGLAVGDNDDIDVVYGNPILVDDDAQGAVEEMLVSAESAAITIAGSPAVDQLCYFRIFRDIDATNDDMAGDCRLHGVKLFFTTDAANDG